MVKKSVSKAKKASRKIARPRSPDLDIPRRMLPGLAPKTSTAIKRMIKRTVDDCVEHKISAPLNQYGQRIQGYGFATATTFSMFDLTTIFDSITQGVGQGNRVGNRIKPTKYTVKGIVYVGNVATPYNDTTPTYLKMVLFRQKSTDAVPTDLSDFMQNGNTVTSPSNTPPDIWRDMNEDKYKIYTSRVYKLADAQAASAPNNDFALSRFFSIDLKKYIKKCVRWDDVTAHPIDLRIMMGFMLCYYDGTLVSLTNKPALNVSYDVECEYTDD